MYFKCLFCINPNFGKKTIAQIIILWKYYENIIKEKIKQINDSKYIKPKYYIKNKYVK